MPVLYLTEQGSSLHCAHGRLRVERAGRVLWCGPLTAVESVLVFGNIQVTTAALSALMARRADVAFLSSKGKLKGRVASQQTDHLALRLRQFERHGDGDFKLGIGRQIVAAKVGNARAVALRWARNTVNLELRMMLRANCGQLLHFQNQAQRAGSISRLLGVEGNAARVHFDGLRVVSGANGFAGRTRPALDPINALLNLGYVLAGHEIASALGAVGLDVSLGLYHVSRSKRAALAYDLLEEFRAPLVDRLVVAQWNLRAVQSGDFLATNTGLRLKPESLKKFLRAYDAALNAPFKDVRDGKTVTFRKLFLLQARRLASAVRDDQTSYIAYRHR